MLSVTPSRVLSLIAACALIALFVLASGHYASTLDQIVASPDVYQVKNLAPNSWLRVGASPDCKGVPCWVTGGVDAASGWNAVDLPSTDLSGYFKAKQPGDKAYYRFVMKVPPALLASEQPLAFTPNWVVHGRYDIYLNGTLVQSGRGLTETGDILYQKAVVSVPRSYVVNQQADIGIVGTLEPQAIGIQHYGKILLGPLTTLNQVHVEGERAMGSYYLIFLLIKASVCVIFALIFAFTKPLPGMGAFVLYALAVALENLAIGNFLEGNLPFDVRVVAYFAIKAGAATALLAFYLRVLKIRRANTVTAVFGVVLTSAAVACAINYNWGSRVVSIAMQHALVNGATFVVALSGWLLAVSPLVRGKIERLSSRYLGFLAATGLYAAGLVWSFYVKTYEGFDARAVVDIGLFYYVALMSIIEFGLSQVRLGLAHQVVGQVLGDSSAQAVLGGVDAAATREVVVAFVDVRHTSNLMHRHGPDRIITAINELFEAIHRIVTGHGGEVHKFLGDTLLISWGMQGEEPNALAATLAMFEVRRVVESLKTTKATAVKMFRGLDVAIGVNSGPAVVGRIGTSERFDFTVMGPTVNEAHRLTAVAKDLGVDLVLGAPLYEQVRDAIVAERVERDDACYKLIGTFDSGGAFVTYCSAWQMQFGWVEKPGLVEDAGANLRSFDLGKKAA